MICKNCNQQFTIEPKAPKTTYCSHPCYVAYKLKTAPSISERLAKYSQAGANGCIEWTGALLASGGYGVINVGGKTRRAHRVAYELAYGALSDDLFVCHKCDNPRCINPEHLFAGSNLDNASDCAAKGRMHPGVRTAGALLDDDKVRAIRARYQAGGISMRAIASEYGISQGAVSRIVNRQGWRHVD